MLSRTINKIAVVAVLIFGGSLAVANSGQPDGSARMHGVSLSWAAPGQRTDGSLVRHGDITGYRIYVAKPSGSRQAIDIDSPHVTQYTVQGLEQGVYRFAVTALDVFGNESPMSRELVYRVR